MKGTIELPTKFFQFIELTKNGEGFFVKCLKCHEFKTVYNKKGNIELLSVTRNSVYNARTHMEGISHFFS
jgi:cytochrome c2